MVSTMNSIIIANHTTSSQSLGQIHTALPLQGVIWSHQLLPKVNTHALSLCVMMSQNNNCCAQLWFKYIGLVLCWYNFTTVTMHMGLIIKCTMSIVVSCMSSYFKALDRLNKIKWGMEKKNWICVDVTLSLPISA